MKIAMILPSLSNTGPGIMVRQLCEGLQKEGHICTVFYFDDIIELKMPCAVQRISFFESPDFSAWDVVHSHMLRPDIYIALHKTLSPAAGSPRFVSTLHNPLSYTAFRTGYGPLASAIGTLTWKAALAAFHSVVVLNHSIYETIRGLSRKRLHVIYNGRDIAPFNNSTSPLNQGPLRALKEKYKIVGTVSSLTKRKGLDQMIKALSQLPQFACVIVGDGPEERSLKELAESTGVLDRCYFAGHQADPLPWYSLFDVFAMCSSSEGFPLALIEAAAHGRPCVLSDIAIFKSILTDRQAVFYKLYNIGSLAGAIQHAGEQAVLYSKAIHDYYQQNLTAKKMVEGYLKIYAEEAKGV